MFDYITTGPINHDEATQNGSILGSAALSDLQFSVSNAGSPGVCDNTDNDMDFHDTGSPWQQPSTQATTTESNEESEGAP
jgi:hypothetical protein